MYSRQMMRAARAAKRGHAPTFVASTAHRMTQLLDTQIARFERQTGREVPPEIAFLREVVSRVVVASK